MNWKAGLAGLSLGAAALLFGAGTAQADNCSQRLQREEWQLHRDISRHGIFSRQARHRQERIERLRWQCSNFRGDRRFDRDRFDRDWNRRHWDRDDDRRFDRRWDRGRGFGFGFGRGFGFNRHRHNRFCRH